MNLADCKARLMGIGVSFERGLTDQEFESIEREHGFRFPEDLKQFLAFALPVSRGWVDWRNGGKEEILSRMQWPFEGICFDIEHNEFWLDEWGEKPAGLPAAFEVVRKYLGKVPTLIPIYSHRFMPDKPPQAGNPVFSVYQTDIIYYGENLESYLRNEFRDAFGVTPETSDDKLQKIEFWSNLVG